MALVGAGNLAYIEWQVTDYCIEDNWQKEYKKECYYNFIGLDLSNANRALRVFLSIGMIMCGKYNAKIEAKEEGTKCR